MSINREMNKEDVVHINDGILLSKKKGGMNNAICSNKDGPRDCLSELSQAEKDKRFHLIIAYKWNLKKKIQTYLDTK